MSYKLFKIVVLLAVVFCAPSAKAAIEVNDPSVFATATGTAAALTSTAQSKIGSGSWQANGTSKSSIWFTPESLGFSASTTISDVESMSFSTFKSTTGGSAPDWYLTVYTAPTTNPSANNGSGWYGLRMTWEGLYSNNFSNPANQWNTYSTDSGTNQLTMIDSNTTNFGFYGAPTLSDIQAANGVVDWSTYPTSSSSDTYDYDETAIIGFVLETGSGWAAGFDGYLDEFEVTVGGVTATVDFEAEGVVPEPVSFVVWSLLGSIALVRGCRSRRGN